LLHTHTTLQEFLKNGNTAPLATPEGTPASLESCDED